MGSRTQPRYPRRSGRGLLSAVTRRIFNPPLAFPSKFSETCECISQSRISRASVGSHRSQSCLYPDRSMSAFRSIFNVAGQTWLLTSATEIRLHSPPASGCSLTRVKRLSVVRHTQKSQHIHRRGGRCGRRWRSSGKLHSHLSDPALQPNQNTIGPFHWTNECGGRTSSRPILAWNDN